MLTLLLQGDSYRQIETMVSCSHRMIARACRVAEAERFATTEQVGALQISRSRVAPNQVQGLWVIQTRVEHFLKGGVDSGAETTDRVGGLGDLPGEVVIKAAEHGQLRILFTRDLE